MEKIFGGFFCSNSGAVAIFCSVEGTATLGSSASSQGSSLREAGGLGAQSSAEGIMCVCVKMNVLLSFTQVGTGTLANT